MHTLRRPCKQRTDSNEHDRQQATPASDTHTLYATHRSCSPRCITLTSTHEVQPISCITIPASHSTTRYNTRYRSTLVLTLTHHSSATPLLQRYCHSAFDFHRPVLAERCVLLHVRSLPVLHSLRRRCPLRSPRRRLLPTAAPSTGRCCTAAVAAPWTPTRCPPPTASVCPSQPRTARLPVSSPPSRHTGHCHQPCCIPQWCERRHTSAEAAGWPMAAGATAPSDSQAAVVRQVRRSRGCRLSVTRVLNSQFH